MKSPDKLFIYPALDLNWAQECCLSLVDLAPRHLDLHILDLAPRQLDLAPLHLDLDIAIAEPGLTMSPARNSLIRLPADLNAMRTS